MKLRMLVLQMGMVALAGCAAWRGPTGAEDETIIFSDVHVNGSSKGAHHALGRLKAAVDRLLEAPPRRVLFLGDHAYGQGSSCDYAVFEPEVRRLERAGVEVVLALGNHDRRKAFFAAFPERAVRSEVPGFAVTRTSLGAADLIVLDSLNEGSGGGRLSSEQGDWLLKTLKAATRPVIVAAHHEVWDLKVGETPLARLLQDDPHVVGYLHGHEHAWRTGVLWTKQEPGTLLQSCGVPSLGAWGDIGYAVLRVSPARIVVESHVEDFYLPEPLPKGARSSAWQQRVDDLRNAKCTFAH